YSVSNIIAILGSGFLGAMVYAFTDTFWFSAVEAEVYATSSLFTAIVFWAILKWENEAHKLQSNRWVILIAYLMGLSIGVHLLNLLAIPAIVLVYYFKKYKVTLQGFVAALLISFGILGVLVYALVPGIVKAGTVFELLFVNGFGFPFHSGVIFYIVLLVGLISFGLYYTHKYRKYLLNSILLGLTFILIGYSSYATVMIRSIADPPMDQNDPETIFNLLSYLNREQYGDRPLFYGQYFNAPVKEQKQGAPVYDQVDGRYEVVDHRTETEYDSRFTGFFPRMYSTRSQHIDDYKSWANISGRSVSVRNSRGEQEQRTVPSIASNLEFFFRYQVGHMYLRYFMWNFSGRQNDIQGHGDVKQGNWISGIPFVDNPRLGSQEQLPDYLKDNPANNKYYMLPFLLGVIGLWYQAKKNDKGFGVVLVLFIFTGLAIVYYLNQTPHQPRERDYAYAGSFYAYAIWIGLSVLAVWDYLRKHLPARADALVSILILLPVPLLMASENWDDHDRSGRYTTRDFAFNYLNSCRENGILFTNGDNDTYPLWYAQEVEGVRTDVRVANLSYLRAGWYLEQMTRKAYESDPLPLTHTSEQLGEGSREALPIYNRLEDRVSIDRVIDFVANESEQTKVQSPFNREEQINYIPSTKFKLEVDKEGVIREGIVPASEKDNIVPEMSWEINRNYLMKDGLCILDLLATNNWERPLHFAVTVGSDKYFNLDKYFRVEGLAYHLAPVRAESTDDQQPGEVNTDVMYDVLMNKFKWGNIEDPDVYLNEDNRRMLINFRNQFGRLADALIREGKQDSAVKVMDRCMEKISDENVHYGYFSTSFIRNYYKTGEREKARKHLGILRRNLNQKMEYYVDIGQVAAQFPDDIRRTMVSLKRLSDITESHGDKDLSEEILTDFDQYMKFLQQNQQLINW
ncbi:MAG: protein O-mannosyl-transferase family, partial [Bacteroidota bacterium]